VRAHNGKRELLVDERSLPPILERILAVIAIEAFEKPNNRWQDDQLVNTPNTCAN